MSVSKVRQLSHVGVIMDILVVRLQSQYSSTYKARICFTITLNQILSMTAVLESNPMISLLSAQ